MDKIRVLVADDHMLVRQGLCRVLERESDLECVAIAEDGKRAIELAKEYQPDVAVIDVSMPNIDGIEAIKTIKRDLPNTAVLVVSAYKYERYVSACLDAGACGYLLKNKLIDSGLTNAIRTVNAGENVFDPEITSDILRRLSTQGGKVRLDGCSLGCRELEVLRLAVSGKSNKKIASELFISEQTVGSHFANIFRKLDVDSRVNAILYALRKGWFTIEDLGPQDEESANTE